MPKLLLGSITIVRRSAAIVTLRGMHGTLSVLNSCSQAFAMNTTTSSSTTSTTSTAIATRAASQATHRAVHVQQFGESKGCSMCIVRINFPSIAKVWTHLTYTTSESKHWGLTIWKRLFTLKL